MEPSRCDRISWRKNPDTQTDGISRKEHLMSGWAGSEAAVGSKVILTEAKGHHRKPDSALPTWHSVQSRGA